MYTKNIIDGHLDIAWGYQSLQRDFLVSAREKSLAETEFITSVEGIATVGYPELRQANVSIVCGTIWTESENSMQPSLGKKYVSIKQAKELADDQLSYYVSLSNHPRLRLVSSTNDINVCLSEASELGIVLLIEGADFIETESDVQLWFNRGVRLIAPVWEKNIYGGCSTLGGGLTERGKKLLTVMKKRNMILDISHMSQLCANESLSEYSGIVVSSHTSCQTICPGERQATDEQIIQIHKSGGLVGLMLWDRILNPGGTGASLDDFQKHIEHIHRLTGGVDCIAIGSSMDGGFGSLSLPTGMLNIGDLPKIADWLEKHSNLSPIDIEKIMYRNWERVLRAAFS
ncbi:MAG: membrane dipeptidase [Oscillospiraceae bacterium]|nr:membrane dipeptidase [Oscillospiraceae bacterium]